MYMVMLVLDNTELLDDVLSAWHTAQIGGVTIVESTGSFRRSQIQAIGARYLFGAAAARTTGGPANLTLFAIVPSEAVAQRCLEVTETVTGDLDEPETGVFAAWPLSLVKGVLDIPKKDEP